MRFSPEWKERMICTCSLGGFVLDFPMGVPTACFPSRRIWERDAPEWAKPHYDDTLAQLRSWRESQRVPLEVGGPAGVYA